MRTKPTPAAPTELPDLRRTHELLVDLNAALADHRSTAEPPPKLVAEWHALVEERKELDEKVGEAVLTAALAGRAAPAGGGRAAEIDQRLSELRAAFDHLPRVRAEFANRVAEAQSALREEFDQAVADALASVQAEAVNALRQLRDCVKICAALQLEHVLPLAVPEAVTAYVPALRDDDGAVSRRAQAIDAELQPIRRAVTMAERALARP